MMLKFWLSREERKAMERERTMAKLRERYERLPNLIAYPRGYVMCLSDSESEIAAAVREAIKDWDDYYIKKFFENLDGRSYD